MKWFFVEKWKSSWWVDKIAADWPDINRPVRIENILSGLFSSSPKSPDVLFLPENHVDSYSRKSVISPCWFAVFGLLGGVVVVFMSTLEWRNQCWNRRTDAFYSPKWFMQFPPCPLVWEAFSVLLGGKSFHSSGEWKCGLEQRRRG